VQLRVGSQILTRTRNSLYCGFDNAIEIFDVGRPGDEGYRLKTTRTRSSRDGQKGASDPPLLIILSNKVV